MLPASVNGFLANGNGVSERGPRLRLRHRLILSGTKSSEGVSHANIDVIVLRVAVTFFTFEARVGTPAVGTLPVGGETVIETRAVNGIGFNGFGLSQIRVGKAKPSGIIAGTQAWA